MCFSERLWFLNKPVFFWGGGSEYVFFFFRYESVIFFPYVDATVFLNNTIRNIIIVVFFQENRLSHDLLVLTFQPFVGVQVINLLCTWASLNNKYPPIFI